MKVWVVLPALNEAANLPAVFHGLKAMMDDTYNLTTSVIVIDDGSTDNTAEVARSFNELLSVQVISNPVNLGLSRTFMHGMLEAIRQAAPQDIIVCMDADNSHIPGQVLNMIRLIREGHDVVIASRYRDQSVIRGVPIVRRILSRGMSILFKAVLPVAGVRDYSCGYRAYRAALLMDAVNKQGEKIFSGDGFTCMVGLLIKLAREDAVFGEIPIVLRYDQKHGRSKMRIGATIVRTIGLLIRERVARRARPEQ